MRRVFSSLGIVFGIILSAIVLGSCGGNSEAETVNVQFLDQDKTTVLRSLDIVPGEKVESWTPEDKEDGTKFVGWYATPSYSVEFPFGNAITEDTKIFSKWQTTAADDRRWEITGDFAYEGLASSSWGSGHIDVDTFVVSKVEGTPNVFEGTYYLYADDEFQFAVFDYSDTELTGKPTFSSQIGYGLLEQGDNNWFTSAGNIFAEDLWKANIKVSVDGQYKFRFTTDVTNPQASTCVVERVGDAPSLYTFFNPVVGGTMTGGGLGSEANQDLFFPVGEVNTDNVTWTTQVSLNKGEKLNILMNNDWGVQLKDANLDDANSDNVVANTGNEIQVSKAGKYEITVIADKKVFDSIVDGQLVVNKDNYKDLTAYKVQVNYVGEYELVEGVTYDTFNVNYTDSVEKVYLRNGAKFPQLADPVLAEGEALAGWYYEVEGVKKGIGYDIVQNVTETIYELEALIINENIKDARVYWVAGQGGTVNGTEAAWSGTKAALEQVDNHTYEATIVVAEGSKFQFQVRSDLFDVYQGIYLRTNNIDNPGEFINTGNLSNIEITKAGTYKLTLNSLTSRITIVEV